MSSKLFTINRKTLSDFNNELFVIPAYQRPYSWGYNEITKLLNDLKENQQDKIYFIGNVIALSNNGKFDLVDGQQRFTTLWMLALYLSKSFTDTDLINFCCLNRKSRLIFAIRDKTNEYLQQLLIDQKQDNKSFWELQNLLPVVGVQDASLAQNQIIANNFRIIDQWIDENNIEKSFLEFIKTKLTFEFLIAPQGTDENKLFIQINTNGAQLQHYDILKSELINAIEEEERQAYSTKWDNCSGMFDRKGNHEQKVSLSISEKLVDILDSDEEKLFYKEQNNNANKKPTDTYQQIISFSTLLIHTLLIYIKNENDNLKLSLPTFFNTDKLLEVFNEFRYKVINANTEPRNKYAKDFIDCLVKIKEQLSNSIIFSDLQDNDFALLSSLQNKQEEKEENDKNIEQLQRMLYHSNNDTMHYWLGIYLDQLLSSQVTNSIKILEKIDNIISIKGNTQATYQSYFKNPEDFLSQSLEPVLFDQPFIFKGFNRYWFYKLEYLLWKKDNNNSSKIISRTSVEHVLPQSQKTLYEEKEIDIDKLGNLILITVSENSGFSDKNVMEKNEYRKKLSNPPLKMIKLFDDLEKNNLIKESHDDNDYIKLIEVLKNHEDEMLKLLIDHYI